MTINFWKEGEKEDLPKLLLIHGFGASGMTYYRIAAQLSKFFRVTTFDLLGMGASGRPKFKINNGLDCIEFFTQSIEAFMQKTNYKEEPYYLMGHSLGAYVAISYSLKYPEKLEKLILFSPVGVPQMPENRKLENIISTSESTRRKLSVRVVASLWETHHISPFSVARFGGYLGANKMMTNYVNRRFSIPQEEKLAIKNLLLQTNMQ